MKIRLWIKWRIARKKVLKRYRELSITEPPEYIEEKALINTQKELLSICSFYSD